MGERVNPGRPFLQPGSADRGLSLVAEGVETDAQYRFLEEIGCNLLQGYWLARPLPADAAREMIPRHRAAARGQALAGGTGAGVTPPSAR